LRGERGKRVKWQVGSVDGYWRSVARAGLLGLRG